MNRNGQNINMLYIIRIPCNSQKHINIFIAYVELKYYHYVNHNKYNNHNDNEATAMILIILILSDSDSHHDHNHFVLP